MAIHLNKASTKELATLPGIGIKYAQIITSTLAEKGNVTIDDFHDTPTLQSKLHELAEKGLLILEYSKIAENSNDPAPTEPAANPITLLANQMTMLIKVVEANTQQVTKTLHELQAKNEHFENKMEAMCTAKAVF